MLDDSPVHIDCVIAIEATMDEMRSQHEATHQLLQDVLDRLSPAPAQNVQSSFPMPPARQSPTPSIPVSSAGRKKLSLKPSLPSEFSGDRTSGKAFLTSCRTYIRLCPEAFEDDLTKVIWAMSYMKTGHAGRWATRELEHEAKTGHLRFLDWLDFEEEFQKPPPSTSWRQPPNSRASGQLMTISTSSATLSMTPDTPTRRLS